MPRRSVTDTPLPGMAPAAPRRRPAGYAERAFLDVVRRARRDGRLEADADALVAATRNVARGIDRLTPGPSDEVRPYDLVPLAQLNREYRENLSALGLLPDSGATRDPFDEFLEGIGAPTRVSDAPEP